MGDENILPLIGISQDARRRWDEAIQEFASNSKDKKYWDPETYPEERAVLVEEGIMALRITFGDGAELEMKFGAGDWCWLKMARS